MISDDLLNDSSIVQLFIYCVNIILFLFTGVMVLCSRCLVFLFTGVMVLCSTCVLSPNTIPLHPGKMEIITNLILFFTCTGKKKCKKKCTKINAPRGIENITLPTHTITSPYTKLNRV